MRRAALLLCLLAASCGNPPAGPAAGEWHFLPHRPEKGALFRYYQAKDRSRWQGNWSRRLDLTGVSWNDRRTATAISPNHVIMAGHFIRPRDVSLMFHDRDGRPHERFLAGVRNLRAVGDIAVGKLNRPLPPGVATYPFASTEEAVIGRPVIVTDQTRTLSVHRIDRVFGRVVRLAYADELDPVYRRNLIKGDSGNPSFLLRPDGSLALLETHTSGGPGAGPFYGDPEVQSAIRAAMAELGP